MGAIIFLTNAQVLKMATKDVSNIIGFEAKNKKEVKDALNDMLMCDPDYLRLPELINVIKDYNNSVRFTKTIAFTENNGIIVTENKLSQNAQDILTDFFNEGKLLNNNIPDTWNAFSSCTSAIAYRGGALGTLTLFMKLTLN